MSAYLAWGTPPTIYQGPNDEPFLAGASGSVTRLPSEEQQGVAGTVRLIAPEGTVAEVIGYSTRLGEPREERFSFEILVDSEYPGGDTLSVLSLFFGAMVADENVICEIYGYVGGQLMPKKLMLVVSKTSEMASVHPLFYGVMSWYEEDAEPPAFWTRFINSKEAIE